MEDAADRQSPYHAGERALQARAGVRARAEQMGGKMIRDYMPDQHRELFAQLPFVAIGSLDAAGRPWASVLWRAPGFVRSPDPRTLWIDALPAAPDPLAAALRPGAPLGLLGIQLETRRRNRANGRVHALAEQGFALHVDQSFGNCPQYITARAAESAPASAPRDVRSTPEGAHLSERARAIIAASDTSFIASASAPEIAPGDRREGVDVSHRGGRPGFVRIDEGADGSVLTIPDFAGNNAFNTLGNLARHPAAGLTFPSFASGELLMLTGRAELIFEGPELARFRGALRLVRLHVADGLVLAGALPVAWSPPDPAPQLARTGAWTP